MNSLPRSSRTLHLRHRDLSSAGGSQNATNVSVVRPMQRLMPRVTSVGQEASVTERVSTDARAPVAQSARQPQPVVMPLEPSLSNVPVSAGPVTSAALLQGNKTVQIMHNGEPYTLRATRHGKLILTK